LGGAFFVGRFVFRFFACIGATATDNGAVSEDAVSEDAVSADVVDAPAATSDDDGS
jgi:hypothetical protein